MSTIVSSLPAGLFSASPIAKPGAATTNTPAFAAIFGSRTIESVIPDHPMHPLLLRDGLVRSARLITAKGNHMGDTYTLPPATLTAREEKIEADYAGDRIDEPTYERLTAELAAAPNIVIAQNANRVMQGGLRMVLQGTFTMRTIPGVSPATGKPINFGFWLFRVDPSQTDAAVAALTTRMSTPIAK